MYIELVRKWDMTRRWESNWMQFEIDEAYPGLGKRAEATCVEFVWANVVGFPGGRLKFIVSNNQVSYKTLKEIEISSSSNIENAFYLNIYFPSFLYYKIIYEPDGIASGELTVGAVYR